jgi:NAD(P)-dependent dehydrogenase (short-subunit alcohol dehydrogenase family)
MIVTGATNGIGLAAAKTLVAGGAEVAIVARSQERAEVAVAEIRRAGGDGKRVDVLLADLSSQAEIRRLAAEIRDRYPRVDVLINNAGAMYTRRRQSVDGIELTWAVNHLAPFLLTTLLLGHLKSSAPARVITTASDAHSGATIPFDDLNADRAYKGFRRYGQSKLANILFTTELARRLAGTGVTANCFHPGFVATRFNHNNGALMSAAMIVAQAFARSPEKGAETLVWLAASPEAADVTGGYFVDRRLLAPSDAARSVEAARRLWDVSERQVGPSSSREFVG